MRPPTLTASLLLPALLALALVHAAPAAEPQALWVRAGTPPAAPFSPIVDVGTGGVGASRALSNTPLDARGAGDVPLGQFLPLIDVSTGGARASRDTMRAVARSSRPT
ncbi:hypothetical protein PsYK624_065230 [Phanerochaete sordida]|uniref:Uncharacterized protein n=1 Tax=Phanerochaete sordida TaxID=48140 RepID=A0A9P3G982_9APHY|nr:hypothetical protein PsYK624_065230 [Phanerochaete sordida]